MRVFAVLAPFTVVAACASPVADVDAVPQTCFEPRAAQWANNGISLNGVSEQAQLTLNGLSLNGVALSAQWSNNGVALSAQWSGNGVELAGDGERVSAHAVSLDGSRLVKRAGRGFVDVVAGDVLAVSAGSSRASVRVLEATIDPADAKLATYRLQIDGQDVCEDGAAGMFVAGHWDDKAAHVDDDTATFSCPHGAIMKCVLWGYAPWNVGADMHETCTRMVRADYCGDGVSWTRNGTLIDVYDTLSIETPVASPALSFEAAWGVDGAVCVDQPRYTVDGEKPSCWDALPRCASLSEGSARGATIADDSAHTPVRACP